MANLAELPKQDLVERAQRYMATARRIREEHKETFSRTVGAGLAVGGGFAGGYIRGAYGGQDGVAFLPGTGIPADAAIGAALVVAGIGSFAGPYSDAASSLGSGMLAYWAGKEGERLGRERDK